MNIHHSQILYIYIITYVYLCVCVSRCVNHMLYLCIQLIIYLPMYSCIYLCIYISLSPHSICIYPIIYAPVYLSGCLSIQSNYCLSTWHILYQILEGPTVSKVATQQAHPALHIPIKKATNYINISGFLWMLAYPFVIKRGKWRFSMVYQWFSWVNQRNKWWFVKLPPLISRGYVST